VLRADVKTARARVAAGFVTISVGCDARAKTACEGRLTLTTPVRGGTLVLGSGEFFIDAGGTDPVQVHLNSRGRKHMASVKTARVRARAVAKDADNRPIDTSRTIILTTTGRSTTSAKIAQVGAATAPVRRGLASVRVTCGRLADGACTGTVGLRIRSGKKWTTIGSGEFLLDAGRTQAVLVALTSRGRSLVSTRHSVRVQARVSAKDDSGKRTIALRTLVLRG
jgi:hypothetical protein